MRGEPTTGRAAELMLLAAVALLTGLFVAASLVRRLNFDEALALRAGWLLWEGIDASPDLYMPWTVALGWLGHLVDDPGAVFAVARTGSVLFVLGALLYLARSLPGSREQRVLFLGLTLGTGAFAVHGYEFRYDVAIVVPLVLGAGLVIRGARRHALGLGIASAVLTMHHLKGVYFGVFLVLVACIRAWRPNPSERRSHLAALATGFGLTWGAWLLVSGELGFGGHLTATYRTFFAVASGQNRVWPWDSLGRYVLRDSIWWLLCVWGLVLASRIESVEGREAARWVKPFGAAALGFLFVHPHPWPYLLALPAPFLAFVVSQGLASRRSRLVVLVGIYLLALAVVPWSPYLSALGAPRERQVESLRWLRDEFEPGDRVLDPSGLAYFIPPCTEEWYIDTLFAHGAAQGRWMAEFADPSAPPPLCDWLVDTYRLTMLPARALERIEGRFVLVATGIAISADDPRAREIGRDAPSRREPLESFWW